MVSLIVTMPNCPQLSFIDLFCGCGGNTWGMIQEKGGMPLKPLLALDIDSKALESYQWNIPGVETIQDDICNLESDIILQKMGINQGELGCIVASPPCQTYSRNNRRAKDKKDLRNTLYKHTLKLISGIKPWVVFMENVPEMATYEGGKYHDDFLNQLKTLGYVHQHWTVNTANYGVPQKRFRLIYLAYRQEMNKIPECPAITHGDSPNLKEFITVKDAIGDLPSKKAGDEKDWFKVSSSQLDKRSGYALELKPVGCSKVYNHAARQLNETQLERLYSLKEGEAYKHLPDHLKPKSGYNASYGRLWRDRPALTLTASLSYPGSGRFSHYEQNRVITVREALRLQSFDDHFRVFGSLPEKSSQVGNAVPPLLAKAFKNQIVKDLQDFFCN